VGERAYDKLGEFGQAIKDAFNRLAKKAEGDSKHNEDGVTLGKFGPVEVLGYPSFNSKEEYTGVELFAKVGNEKMFVLSGHCALRARPRRRRSRRRSRPPSRW
jgi:hypothetical protein